MQNICSLFLPSRGVSVVLFLLIGLAPCSVAAQGVVSRTSNLTDGWVSSPGTIQFNFNHRFRLISTTQGNTVLNSPSFLLGVPLPGDLLVAGRYASDSRVAEDRVNEWEAFARWAPPIPTGRADLAISVAYNRAAESADAELAVRIPIGLPESSPVDSIGFLGAGRVLSETGGSDGTGWFMGGGVVLHVGDRFSISGDGGKLSSDGPDERAVWGAGIQVRIPTTPHTLAIQATNTRTGTLQGASVGDQTYWGFEFTALLSR